MCDSIMHYECPICSSMKKPKIINYFVPITARCIDCGYEDQEKEFIRQEKSSSLVYQ